jgi:hypothetical protein
MPNSWDILWLTYGLVPLPKVVCIILFCSDNLFPFFLSGDDYIFHCHPTEQKIPKPKRLQEWYKKMLDKGIIERIVLDYKDILKQATEDNFRYASELPYFEGKSHLIF